jgi:hypothetical protein
VLRTEVAYGELTITVPSRAIDRVLTFLRDDGSASSSTSSMSAASTIRSASERFDVVYTCSAAPEPAHPRQGATDEDDAGAVGRDLPGRGLVRARSL